ncbi:hypothetical protein Nepgr_022170 [Nepenthes gracilis]|uniref:Transmembrane protein n=1 Tax=Nepenthes gracilis TaxID=150966 RepID=A0AAD3T0D6_NEPGR|nr:hypothetical protein Nepgr_022170 [Nepenthes gracilis]
MKRRKRKSTENVPRAAVVLGEEEMARISNNPNTTAAPNDAPLYLILSLCSLRTLLACFHIFSFAFANSISFISNSHANPPALFFLRKYFLLSFRS